MILENATAEELQKTLLKRSCLVVAHPDDEILWFSSILAHVDRVIICYLANAAYPGRGLARRRVLDQYPLDHVECLGWDVPLTGQMCDWNKPLETEFGLQLPSIARGRYEHSFVNLKARV